MSRPLPRYCGYRTCTQQATHLIDGKCRHTLACSRHLDKQLRWVGEGARALPIPNANPLVGTPTELTLFDQDQETNQ